MQVTKKNAKINNKIKIATKPPTNRHTTLSTNNIEEDLQTQHAAGDNANTLEKL